MEPNGQGRKVLPSQLGAPAEGGVFKSLPDRSELGVNFLFSVVSFLSYLFFFSCSPFS